MPGDVAGEDERTKVLLTQIPHFIDKEAFLQTFQPWVDQCNYTDFYTGKKS